MTMEKDIYMLFLERYFGNVIPDEFAEYLMLHYGDIEEWNIEPPILWLWIREDLCQYKQNTFETPENVELRRVREHCLGLMYGADELYMNSVLKANEVRAVYDTIFWIYLSRTCSPEKIREYTECAIPFDN